MHRSFHTMCLLSLLALPSIALKSSAADAPTPSPAVVQKPASPPAFTDDPIVPEINFNGVSLEDAISSLSDTFPKFKVAILRDPNVQPDFPTVNLKLKGVSLSQFMELIQTANPTVESKEIDGPGGKIICLLVHAAPDGHGAVMAGGGAGGGIAPNAAIAPVVRVYRLSAILGLPSGGKTDPTAKKEAMNQALSLIKVALEQVGGEPPVLRIHDETQTLIFRGSPAQEAMLENVMDALKPREMIMTERQVEDEKQRIDHAVNEQRNRMNEDVARAVEAVNTKAMMRAQEMDQQMARLQKALDQRDKETLDHASETEKLKVRLEMTQVNTDRLERALAKKTDEAREIRSALDAAQSSNKSQPANSK